MQKKKREGSKDKTLAFMETESDESSLDDEDIVVISRNFTRLFKKGGNYERKSAHAKKRM